MSDLALPVRPVLQATDRRTLSRAIGHWVGATLSRKMTLFFGGLFAVALGLILIGSRIVIEHYAERIVYRELTAQRRVFQRLAMIRYDQLQQAAQIFAFDSDFQSAVTSHDGAAINAALAGSRTRLDVTEALFVDPDGGVIGLRERFGRGDLTALAQALRRGASRGVMELAGECYRVVAVPVEAPSPAGWVVFTVKLGEKEMRGLATLSAMPTKVWVVPAARVDKDVPIAKTGTVPFTVRRVNGERILIQASPVLSFDGKSRQALVLAYSLTRALHDYAAMFWLMFACGVAGVGVTIAGSWYLSRKLARPIEALDCAARRVSSGEFVHVTPETKDEIGRLAISFNKMVDDIRDRERQLAETQADASADLQRTVHRVQAENRHLNEIAQRRRSAVMSDAAADLEHELAPLLLVFDAEASRLAQAALNMEVNLSNAKERVSDAAQSATSTEQLTQAIAFSAQELAGSGKEIAGEASLTLDVVSRAARDSARATRSFADLRLAVDDIGSVTDEIRLISSQTNMLALNATIEAARAGEMGRSFAVVAGEVKELARQTALLTAAIGDRLAQVEEAMLDADHAVGKVSRALIEAGEVTKVIASAANRQSHATLSISGGISEIASDSRAVVSAITQVDAAALESKQVAEQVQSSAQAVATRAVALRHMLDQFLDGLRQTA